MKLCLELRKHLLEVFAKKGREELKDRFPRDYFRFPWMDEFNDHVQFVAFIGPDTRYITKFSWEEIGEILDANPGLKTKQVLFQMKEENR